MHIPISTPAAPQRPASGLAFKHGQLAVFDAAGNQIGELQKSWPVLFAENAEREGYNPEGLVFDLQFGGRIRIIRGDGRWSYDVVTVGNSFSVAARE